jgi:hypothetical protein
MTRSVAASPKHPLGPAAAEVSARSLTLRLSCEHAPFGFITSIHNQQDEVGSFAAELEADVYTFKSLHGGRSPDPRIVLSAAAHHNATAEAAADFEAPFLTGGKMTRHSALPIRS